MKAVITAGGKGTRLFPISRAFPKELISFCGIPVIEYGINILKENGIEDILIVTGTRKGALQDYLGNGEIFGVDIAYVIQEQPKGLGHSVLIAEHHIYDDNFVLLLGDTIFISQGDLKHMVHIHEQYDAFSTILVEHVTDPEKYGVVKFDTKINDELHIHDRTNKIISLYEKPKDNKIKEEFKINNGWHSIAGLYIFNRDIFNFLRQTPKDNNNEIQLTDAIRLSLENDKTALGHILDGKRIDVGGWAYLKEERDFYKNMTDEKLDRIIKSRYEKMEYIKDD